MTETNNQKQVQLCVNCLYFNPAGVSKACAYQPAICSKIHSEPDVVYGLITYAHPVAARADAALCGKSGRFFVQRPPKISLFARFRSIWGDIFDVKD